MWSSLVYMESYKGKRGNALRVIGLKPFGIDGADWSVGVWFRDSVVTIIVHFLHNIRAFPLRSKLGS